MGVYNQYRIELDETWELDSFDADKYPAALISIPLKNIFLNQISLLSASFSIKAGGTGYLDDLLESNGFKILIWVNGKWEEIAQGDGSFNNSETVGFSIVDKMFLDKILFGPEKTIHLSIIPKHQNSKSGNTSAISVDYFEMNIKYSLSE